MMRVNFCPFDGYPFILDETRCGICGIERNSILKPQKEDKPPWKKVLYIKQPYPDNYTDKSFLTELQKNVNMIDYDYYVVMEESFVVTQQLTVVALFVAMMVHMLNNEYDWRLYVGIDAVLFVIGYICWIILTWNSTMKSVARQISNLLRFAAYAVGLYVISPILGTLTHPVSDDTITTLCVLCFTVHLYFQDYAYLNAVTEKFSAPIAQNAAIFASVMLASRLESHLLVFALVAFSILIFGLFPILYHYLKRSHRQSTWILLLISVIANLFLYIPISKAVAVLYIGACVLISFISPLLLKLIMQYKDEIHGPWDEAVPIKRASSAQQ